jgi:hypothetical protein
LELWRATPTNLLRAKKGTTTQKGLGAIVQFAMSTLLIFVPPFSLSASHPCLYSQDFGKHVKQSLELQEVVIDEHAHETSYLENNFIKSLAWSGVNVVVSDRETKNQKKILTNVSGHVMAGWYLPRLNRKTESHSNHNHRRDDGYHGPIRVWENHPPQRACSPPSIR